MYIRGGSRISRKGVHMYKSFCGWGGGCFVYLIIIFLKSAMKMNNLVSLRQNYFIFIEYFKTGRGGGSN